MRVLGIFTLLVGAPLSIASPLLGIAQDDALDLRSGGSKDNLKFDEVITPKVFIISHASSLLFFHTLSLISSAFRGLPNHLMKCIPSYRCFFFMKINSLTCAVQS